MTNQPSVKYTMEESGSLDKGSLRNDRQRVTCRLVICIIGAAMGSLQFGYNLGVINAPESLIKAFMNQTYFERYGEPISSETETSLWALTASIFSVGGCFGGFLAGWWATKLGRKRGSLFNVAFGVIAGVLMFVSKSSKVYELLIVGRIIVGFHCGLYTGLSPMYLSEISTPKIRGAIGVLHQLAIVTGLLISQILGFPDLLGNEAGWDYLIGLAVVPCLLQLLILPTCPESPRYLLINAKDEMAARDALRTLRDIDNVEDEIDEIKHEMNTHVEEVSIIQLFKSPSLRPPILIGIVMQLSQQFSGINGVFYYSTGMFVDVGLSEADAKYTTSAVGAIMVTMTFVTVPLMDRAGRRTLHLLGLAGMAIFSVLNTVALCLKDDVSWFKVATVPLMLTYVVFFALGPGSIPWLIVAELFAHNARPAAISLCVLVNWVASFLVGFIFPYLQEELQSFTFLPFTILLVCFFVFTFFKVPETKGKTFEEVTAIWRAPNDVPSFEASEKASDDKLTSGFSDVAGDIGKVGNGLDNGLENHGYKLDLNAKAENSTVNTKM